MKRISLLLLNLLACTLLIAQSSNSTFDSYINSPNDNVFEEIAGPGNLIAQPNDLDFNPDQTNGFPALWVINEGTINTGGSTVTIFNPGESSQTTSYKKDGNSWHFMALPSALAFGDHGHWANSTGILSANHNGSLFTGPSLWASDFSIYAITPPGGNGSHLDMLHQSPYSMGIAHEVDNIYWVFDGYHQTIVMYDFAIDHGPGNSYHDDGRVHYYYEVSVSRDLGGVPSHMVLDKATDWLYINDIGNQRIIRMKVGSAVKDQNLPFNMETLAERWSMKNVTQEVVATGLSKPCGIDVIDDRLVVTDNGTNEIIIYDISTNTISEVGRISVPHSNPNIRGVKVDPQGNIWFVDYTNSKVFKLSNQGVVGIQNLAENSRLSIFPNPAVDYLNIQNPDGLEISSIRILGIQGNEVFYSENIRNTVNVSDLQKGMYFIYLQDSEGAQFVQKFYKN
jgi:sugar lactone lactonase YvrE